VLKTEDFDIVGLGWIGPNCKRRALKARSGSEASRLTAGRDD
jgi:hypothetical protein